MTDRIGKVEVAFAATFSEVPSSSIRITTEPPRTLNLEEAEKSAGFFDFEENEEFKKRFIIWRAYGSNLLLEEHCLDTALRDNNLSICLHGSQIIPGTCICLADSFLFIYCPTQTAIHRFFLHIPTGFTTSSEARSVLGLLYDRSTHLREIHDSYELNSQSIALRAHIAHAKLDLYATFFLRDMQLIRLCMQSFPATLPNVEVTYLHGEGLLQRMVRSSATKNVSSIASCIFGNKCFFFVLFSTGVIQAYSKERVNCSKNLMDYLIGECVSAQGSLMFTALKIAKCDGSLLLLCHAQNESNENFVVVSKPVSSATGKPKDLLESFKTTLVPAVDVVDFAYFSCDNKDKLIVLSRTEFKHSVLLSSTINWETEQFGTWEMARALTISGSEQSEYGLECVDLVAAKKKRIFDQNNYSFDVVLRAALLVCKHCSCEGQLQKLQSNDWSSLRSIIDVYVVSPQFEEQYSNRYERAQNRNGRGDASSLKFWSALEKSCNELLEADCLPLGVWCSTSIGLYGTLQKGRFTVCVDEDRRMEWIEQFLSPNTQKAATIVAFQKCLAITKQFTSTQVEAMISDDKQQCFVHSFSIASDLAAELLKKYVDTCCMELKKPTDLLIDYNFTESRTGAFLPSLVSAALRQRISDRLLFTDALLSIIKIYYVTFEKCRSSMSRWQSALTSHGGKLQVINKLYRILLQALTIRLHKTQAEVSLGDSYFFNGGLEVVRNHFLVEEYLDDDAKEEDMDSCTAETGISMSSGTYVSDYLSKVISTAIAVLSPENVDLIIAQYLSRVEQFEALLDFCLLNEPYDPKLLYAFQFFKGIAFAGIGRPEDATQMFFDAFKGIEENDYALQRVLFRGKRSSVSRAEFFLKVMEIMEKQNCNEQVVIIGRLALRKIEAEDSLLAHVYTMLFKHELATSMYTDCIATLLKNPSNDNRKMCLRELIAKLIDCGKRREIVRLDYGRMQGHVVEILEARARSADLANEEFLYETLFSFHFYRSNFCKAAITMYEYATRLRSHLQTRETLACRCRLLSVVQQTLMLVPVHSRYLTLPNEEMSSVILPENSDQSHSEEDGRMMDETISAERGDSKSFVGSLKLLEEFIIEDSRLALFDENVKILNNSGIYSPPLDINDILHDLLERNMFHRAWLLTGILQISPYEVIRALVKECIHYYASGDKKDPVWASRMKHENYSLSEKDGCSAVLRGYVEAAARDYPHDAQVLRSACDVFLKHDWPIPCWLSMYYEEHFLADYLNLLLLYGQTKTVCSTLIKVVELTTSEIKCKDSQVLLPYRAIDQLYYLVSKLRDHGIDADMKKLDLRLQQYFNRLDSFSRN